MGELPAILAPASRGSRFRSPVGATRGRGDPRVGAAALGAGASPTPPVAGRVGTLGQSGEGCSERRGASGGGSVTVSVIIIFIIIVIIVIMIVSITDTVTRGKLGPGYR